MPHLHKGAAGNMANRLLQDLSAWVKMPESDLKLALANLENTSPSFNFK